MNYHQTVIPFTPLYVSNPDSSNKGKNTMLLDGELMFTGSFSESSSQSLAPTSALYCAESVSSGICTSAISQHAPYAKAGPSSAIKLRGRPRHKVWNYFMAVENRQAKCIYCSVGVDGRTNQSMKRHITLCAKALKAGVDLHAIYPDIRKKSLRELQIEQNDRMFNKDRTDDLLAKMLITSGAPFTILSNGYFKDYSRSLNSRYTPFSRTKFSESILYNYTALIAGEMNHVLEEHKRCTLIIDGWSTRSKDEVYGLVLAFPNRKEYLHAVIDMEDKNCSSSILFDSIIDKLTYLF